MPIFWKSKILLAKIEGTYGTDSAPTGGDNAILAINVQLTPMEGQDVSRELELPYLAAHATIPAGLFTRLQFRVELVPSGDAGVAPAWGPILRACGVAQTVVADTSVTYAPITTGHESVTIHFWIGGTRFVMKGSRGTAVISGEAQGVPVVDVTLTGLFSQPSEVSRPSPDFDAFLKPDLVTDINTPTFTIDGVSLVMRRFSLDLRNDVQTRFLVGSESIIIPDRNELFSTQVEAVPLSTWNPFAKAADQERVPIVVAHGTVAGRIVTLEIDEAQVQRPAGLANEQNVAEWPLTFVPLPASGNDQWALTLT
ncbi:hypothetical protein SAMN02983003_3175 [Devosia enhydra]|uniref:Uncharacterized protein n=1 Tax=Devosia enhydra TaxID=665118 RepID=A0A1K2I1A7_9HYPH|nr:hypothetical protein [Devosia enhydra]SFZ86003.1 hypothetical protein SAMN02983003_3175 [Devosia enhydra]